MSFGNSGDFDGGNRPRGQNTGSPYATGPGQTVPPKSNAVWWILGILGVLTVGGIFVCCGGGYFMFRFGTQAVADAVKSSISTDPVIQEHIGNITDLSMNLTATGAAGGGDKMVLDIKGDKGTGQVEVVMGGDPTGQSVKSCVLILPNGERIPLAVGPAGHMTLPEEAIETKELDPLPSADANLQDAAPETEPATI